MHICPNELLAVAIALPFVGAAAIKITCFCQRCLARIRKS